MSWLNITGYVVLSIAVWLIALGAGLTLVYGIVRGMLFLLRLTSLGLSWLWHWLTGKPPRSWGTAHWAREAEIAAKGLFNPGSIPLGTWQGKPLYESFGGHVALIGPPRSRKSWGLVMPAIEQWEGSLLVNDPRGELFNHTVMVRREKGPVYRFSPTQRESCHLNVLDAVRWGEPEQYGDVQRVVHGMLAPDPGEPWNDFRLEAKPLLEAIIWDRQAAGEGNFPAVLRWMTEPSRSMQEKAKELLRSPIAAVSAGGRRLVDKSERLASAVWSAALSSLTIYQDPLVAEHTSRSDLDLSDLQQGTRPVSLYLTPPFADVARLRPLVGTLTEMLVSRFSAQQDTPRQRVLLCLDEAMNMGRLDELERGMSFLQGCGVQTLLTIQNVLQCRQVYGPNSPLLASVATKVLYTPSDQETAEWVSEQLGVTTERLHPETRSFTSWGLFSHRSLGTSEHARPLWTPDEVARMDEHNALVLAKGTAPIVARKLGSPAAVVVDVASPRRKVAVIAATICLGLGLGAWWFLQSPEAPPPVALSTPSVTATPTTAAAPDPGRAPTFEEWTYRRRQSGWALWKHTDHPMPMLSLVQPMATHDTCEATKATYLQQLDARLAQGSQAGWREERLEAGSRRTHPALGKRWQTIVYVCAPYSPDGEPSGPAPTVANPPTATDAGLPWLPEAPGAEEAKARHRKMMEDHPR
jgi:type IV secretion system protein VirD4